MPATKVLYLLGAGATHGVVKEINPFNTLLPQDVRDRMCTDFARQLTKELDGFIFDELVATPDVEQFLSILEYRNDYHSVSIIRKYYHGAIRRTASNASDSPPIGNLYSVLLDYQMNLASAHRNESLLGFVTFNYEDILERTIKTHFNKDIDYLFQWGNRTPTSDSIRIYKLHGSFNWHNTRPISVRRMRQLKSEATLWIPPGLDKKKDNYPFNLLWGRLSEELATCDLLRIIGCSLSRNDWGLIPILFNVQRLRRSGIPLKIEVVDFPSTAKTIKENYRYLDIAAITSMDEIRQLLAWSFSGSDSDRFEIELCEYLDDKEKINPFKTWLQANLEFLNDQSLSLETPSNIAKDFLEKS